ncbi:MAG TPA: Spy/CpxP family protein refolding chaperone, partial [Pyrinomonadaceae bacterium]|nr:Spy/CpxP family protein refolding chaperone [Pyrinomonadaceae bacterium]
MRNRILAVAGIAVLLIGATVFALGHGLQGYGQGKGERQKGPVPGPEMVEHLASELGLNADQQTQIKTLFEGARAAEEPRHARLEDLQKQLEAATANGQFDEAKVREIANQKAQLMADQMVEHLRMKSKVYSILTPEQRTKADQMHKRGGPYRRHGHPPPP